MTKFTRAFSVFAAAQGALYSSAFAADGEGTPMSSIITALDALADNLPAFIIATIVFCYLMAFLLGISFINQLRKAGNAHQNGGSNPINAAVWTLVVMIALVTLPQVLKATHATLGYQQGFNQMDYGGFDGTDQSSMQENVRADHPLRPVILLVNVIGLIAVIRGFMSFRRAGRYGNQERGIQKGIVLILAGFFALNITLFMLSLAKTFNMPIIGRILDLT